ncbi:MAG: hypothetical protein ACFB21_04020 [Opitutales bacterium]
MRISRELYSAGVLGHQRSARRGDWEYFNPGKPHFGYASPPRRSARAWRALLNVFRPSR